MLFLDNELWYYRDSFVCRVMLFSHFSAMWVDSFVAPASVSLLYTTEMFYLRGLSDVEAYPDFLVIFTFICF
jgi:hypothetical protein